MVCSSVFIESMAFPIGEKSAAIQVAAGYRPVALPLCSAPRTASLLTLAAAGEMRSLQVDLHVVLKRVCSL